jgi:hypothetical protein
LQLGNGRYRAHRGALRLELAEQRAAIVEGKE